jgi:dethiobiotin synthetase
VTSPAPRGLFLVGTDTGVGKTALGCALLRLAVRAGLRPVPWKPVETGCDPEPADAAALLRASARSDLSLADVCPFRYPDPVAPALAATDPPLRLSALQALLPPHAARGDFFLVESAGGLLSPYALDFTGADLAAAAGLPLLLVARNALGTINHTALALAEIGRRALPLAGVVLMEVSAPPTPDRPHNARLIEALTGERPLASLPFLPGADPDLLADELQRQIDTASIADLLGLSPAGAR